MIIYCCRFKNRRIIYWIHGEAMNIKQIVKKNTYINRIYTEFKLSEKEKSYGSENPDKVFYVIRRISDDIGLFSYVMTNLGHIKYAVDKGYIPVIDMQNYSNTYLKQEEVGIKNAWEFFFEQPMGYTLDNISKSKHVILSRGDSPVFFPGIEMVNDENVYQYWKEVADQYLRINIEMKQLVEEKKRELFGNQRVLGVLCRGTDYVNRKPYQHPIQPRVEDMIIETMNIMESGKCESVFLATEDEEIYQRFQNVFGNKLRSIDMDRYNDTGNENINLIVGNKAEKRINGMKYLLTICLLASCHYFIAGCSGGTYGTMLLMPKEEKRKIFYLGLY